MKKKHLKIEDHSYSNIFSDYFYLSQKFILKKKRVTGFNKLF